MATLGERCLAAITEAANGELTDADIKAEVKRLTARAAMLRRSARIADDADAILAATKQLQDEAKIKALIEKRSRAINVLRKKDRDAYYARNTGDEANAIQAITVGVEGPKFGYANSTEALQHAERSRIVTGLSLDLERAEVDKRIEGMSRDDNMDLAKEMSRATKGPDAPTGNKLAEQVAQIYSKWLEIARVRRNDTGAWTRDLWGFIVPQSHDQFKIRGAGKEADYVKWRDYISPRLDERTFDEIGESKEEREQFLRDTWTSLSTGVHLKSTESDWLGGFTGGTQNLAKRASQERTLHFKDAGSWFEYNEKFGTGNIHQAVSNTLERSARDIGLLKKWGTNPQAAFNADVKQLLTRAKDRGDLAQIDALSGKTLAGRRMLAMMGQIDGSANIAGSPTLARLGRNIRGFETIGKLTGTVLSSFGDLTARASALEWHGQGYFATLGKGVGALLQGRGDLEARELLHRIGSMGDGVIGDIASRFDAADKFDGRMAKLVKLDMILNGQKYWTDVLANQSTKDISTSLGLVRDRAFTDLPERTRISLQRYGITESHWDYARANTIEDHAGRAHVVSDSIRYEPDEVIAKMIGKPDASPAEIARFRDRFEDNWRSYFVSSTREALTEPTAMTRYVVTAGTTPGTTSGELIRMVAQFKSFSTAFVQLHINRELNRGTTRNYAGLIKLIVGATAMGYLGGVVKDTARLRSPKEWSDFPSVAKIVTDALVRGGGLGILGDIIFNDWSKQNGGVANLLGPTAGSLGDLFGLAQATMNELAGVHDSNLLAKTEQIISNHIPYINLFYTRAAYEFLILQGMQESANPGYLGRMQRRLERENHQHMLVAPLY